MNIKGKNKAKILAALYNNTPHLGSGHMSESDARELLDSGQTYFDYLHGRVMKIDLSGDELKVNRYDRDNGDGECERVVNAIVADENV